MSFGCGNSEIVGGLKNDWQDKEYVKSLMNGYWAVVIGPDSSKYDGTFLGLIRIRPG